MTVQAPRICVGPSCFVEPRGKLSVCDACSVVQDERPEIFAAWLDAWRALRASGKLPVSDVVWDRYLEARASFLRAKERM